MKRMPFERPTEHYDERIAGVDEQLCALLKQRKDMSDNDPGYPPFETIACWARDYGFEEDFLKSLFGLLLNESHFKPIVEPAGFRKQIPIMQTAEKDGFFYFVNSMRQYDNASALTLAYEWDIRDEAPEHPRRRGHFELFIGERYECRSSGGGSSQGHASCNYIVTPPLPDDMTGIKLVFRQYEAPFNRKPTGLELVFRIG